MAPGDIDLTASSESVDLGEPVLEFRVVEQRLMQHQLLVVEESLSVLLLQLLSNYTLYI